MSWRLYGRRYFPNGSEVTRKEIPREHKASAAVAGSDQLVAALCVVKAVFELDRRV